MKNLQLRFGKSVMERLDEESSRYKLGRVGRRGKNNKIQIKARKSRMERGDEKYPDKNWEKWNGE